MENLLSEQKFLGVHRSYLVFGVSAGVLDDFKKLVKIISENSAGDSKTVKHD